MKPFPLVIQRDELLVPREVTDAFGNVGLVRPRDEDVPRHLLLQLHGFPSDAVSIDIVYPKPLTGDEKMFPHARGHLIVDTAQGYLRRVLAASPPYDMTHYDVIDRLLAVYRAYVRNLPVHDDWRWHAIFTAEIMHAYWADNAHVLKMLTRMPPAP